MTFKEYINNSQLALATEIFNANAKTVEEMQSAIERAKERCALLRSVLYKYSKIYSDIVEQNETIDKYESKVKKLCEFNNSHEAKLIADFIQNGNGNAFIELKMMIEKSNPFEISIVPAWKKGDGERMYGVPYDEFFHIGYTYTYYRSNNWDIESDICNCKDRVCKAKRKLNYLHKQRNKMLSKYSKSLAMLDSERYCEYDYDYWED